MFLVISWTKEYSSKRMHTFDDAYVIAKAWKLSQMSTPCYLPCENCFNWPWYIIDLIHLYNTESCELLALKFSFLKALSIYFLNFKAMVTFLQRGKRTAFILCRSSNKIYQNTHYLEAGAVHSLQIRCFENFSRLTCKQLCWSLCLIKLQAFGPTTLLKRDSSTVIFNRTPPGDFFWLLELCKFSIKIEILRNFRSSRPKVFCEKDVLRNFTKFTGKHLRQSLIFNKVVGLRPATLLKMGI